MKVLVCGSRFWKNKEKLYKFLDELEPYIDTVIEGEAPGADSMARDWALENQIPVKRYPANWDEFGKKAGPIRNRQMLMEGNPDLVIAFHEKIEKSKGTKDMINVANKAKVSVILVD